jgi:hypothetical protein
MAFADWEFFKRNGAESVVIDLGSPINGAGSLQMTGVGDGSSTGAATIHLTNATDSGRGRTQARMETIFQRNQPTAGGFAHGAGFYFMPSSVTPWTSGQSMYFAGMSNSTSATRWAVIKFTNGFGPGVWEASAGATVLSTSTTNLTADGADTAIQVDWNDAPEFGGVKIVLRAAPSGDTDFGNVVDVIDFTDTSTPLTNSGISEGLLIVDVNGLAGVNQVKPRFDDTSIYSLVAA